MTEISRRSLLQFGGGALSAAALSSGHVGATSATAATPQWAGHKPGQVYLGLSTTMPLQDTLRRTGPVGLRRTYHRWQWTDGERRAIVADHGARRMPWVSFKPPSGERGTWRAIANGQHDAEIRRRARGYASLSKPVVVTFNHEPNNDHVDLGADFSRAWCRIYDVMKQETNLRNVVSVPIIGEWAFNPINRRMDPRDWVTPQILSRCSFQGLDLYQTKSGEGYAIRLGRVFDLMSRLGFPEKMVGIGETGSCNSYPNIKGPAWWHAQWQWSTQNTDKIGAISWFNSLHNNNSGNNWLLWETSSKLEEYKNSLSSWKACGL